MSSNQTPIRKRDQDGGTRRRHSRDAQLDKNLQNLASKAESRLDAKRKARAEARAMMRARHEEMERKAAKRSDETYKEEASLEQKMDVLKLKLADSAVNGARMSRDISGKADSVINDGVVLQLKQQLANAISAKNELELSKTQLYFTIEDLRDRLEAAEADVYTAVANQRQIKKSLQLVENERDNKARAYEACLRERDKAEHSVRDLESKLESNLESKQSSSEDHQQVVESLKAKVNKGEDLATELRGKIVEMTNERRAMTEQLDESKRRAQVEIAEALANNRRKVAVSGDSAVLKSENEDLKVDRARLERQLNKQLENNKRDKASMEELEEANLELRKETRKQNRELRSMRSKLADSEMLLERIKKQ